MKDASNLPFAKHNEDPILGRLALWRRSVKKSLEMLRISKKAIDKWHELCIGAGRGTRYRDHDEAFEGDEFFAIHQYSVDIAVIFFCHVFDKSKCGDKNGKIAGNNSLEIKNIRRRMISRIVRDGVDIALLKRLKRIMREYRDMNVAHNDGDAFTVHFLSWESKPAILSGSTEFVLIDFDDETIEAWFQSAKIMESFIEKEIADRRK